MARETSRPPAATGSPFFREHDSAASSFVDELARLGFSKHDAHDLVDRVVAGDALVTADAGENVAGAVAILERHQADIRYANGMSPDAAAGTLHDVDAVATHKTDEDRQLRLRAERLVVNKQRVQHGEARVRKEIVTEVKSIDVPVSHEELVIERHAVSAGESAGSTASIGEETIRVPLTEERVDVTKQTVVREEVTIGKRSVENTERIVETLRHEELEIDNSTSSSDSKAVPKP